MRFGCCIAFGGERNDDALSVSRSALLVQLGAIKASSAYQTFLRQRAGVAQQLAQAREESRAQHFRVRSLPAVTKPVGWESLPPTLT